MATELNNQQMLANLQQLPDFAQPFYLQLLCRLWGWEVTVYQISYTASTLRLIVETNIVGQWQRSLISGRPLALAIELYCIDGAKVKYYHWA